MVKVNQNRCRGQAKPLGCGALPSRCGSTQNTAANVRVVVRVRPANQRESEKNHRNVIDVVDEKMLVFDPKEEQLPFYYQGIQQPNRNFLKRPNKEMMFVFDHVCNQDATNQEVFETTTKDILASLMDGYNCSVFVYGATGAGKTFTMIGNMENPGITYLTMEHLFYSINSFEKDREFDIAVSYIEVYNENVYDLLKPSQTPLQLREDNGKYGVRVAGITVCDIKTAKQLLDLLDNGNRNRKQHPTDANAESSRSHAVFQVYISMRNRTSGQVRTVKLSMIDLAGSERASATGCKGDRFKEGANINRSLLSLGNCINKLADGSTYIPYRDSKLTRLLKDSLGGNCKTVMIANVSPSSLCFEDTYNTLKYAARANKIQLSVSRNIVDGDMRTSQYVKVNEELRKKVKELEAKLALSSQQLPAPAPTPVPASLEASGKEKEWRARIDLEARRNSALELRLLSLMSRQRVLALRHRLRTRAFMDIVELAHRSSTEGMDQICTEDIPRQERIAESYLKQSVALDSEIDSAWTNWSASRDQFDQLCDQALLDCPSLQDLVQLVKLQSKYREMQANDESKLKLLLIQNYKIDSFSVYLSEMAGMLKKLYLTLKGFDMAPPGLTDEYLEIIKKAKSAKGISWSDESITEVTDSNFKFITALNLDKPSSIPDLKPPTENVLNATVDIVTDSDDLTDQDQENKEPIKKRKGTPIKLANNETIVIDDSFEALDTTRTMNSAKKVKREFGQIAPDVENCAVIDPKDLNSTFVLAGKIEAMRKLPVKQGLALPVKQEPAPLVKRGLTDRTNVQRTIAFNDNKPKIVKPVVGKAFPFRRPAVVSAVVPAAPRPPGFGSSLSRDGTPLPRNTQVCGSRSNTNVTERSVGFKAVRARERVQTHPYSRPNAFNRR